MSIHTYIHTLYRICLRNINNVLSLYDLFAKVLYTHGGREDSEPSIPQTHHQITTKSGILSDYMSEWS